MSPVPVSLAAELSFKPSKVFSITVKTVNDLSYYSEEMATERAGVVEQLKVNGSIPTCFNFLRKLLKPDKD